MSLTLVCQSQVPVTAPVCADGTLYVVAAPSGQVLRLDAGALAPVLETNGSPTGMAADSNGDIYIADNARQSVVKIEAEEGGAPQLLQFLEEFEGKAFRGPNHIAFGADGEVYFTDSGALGDTSLAHPRGAVYRTVQNRQQVVMLAPPSLAFPTGIACGPSGCVYVAELNANRVLRYAQRPQGVFHGSVFVQLHGGLGPMDLAVHPKTGDVYVAQYDFVPEGAEVAPGSVVVYSPAGEEKGTIKVPGSEISGLAFDAEGKTLYITERTSIYSIPTA
jgi:gluconolactonase